MTYPTSKFQSVIILVISVYSVNVINKINKKKLSIVYVWRATFDIFIYSKWRLKSSSALKVALSRAKNMTEATPDRENCVTFWQWISLHVRNVVIQPIWLFLLMAERLGFSCVDCLLEQSLQRFQSAVCSGSNGRVTCSGTSQTQSE